MNNVDSRFRKVYFLTGCLLVWSLVIHLGRVLKSALVFNYDSFGYSEFLINFRGGYVRRGLLGEGLFQLCELTGMDPGVLILSVSICAYLIVTGFFFRQFRLHGYCWFLILSPLFCGYVEEIVRKDFLQYGLLILMMLCLTKGKSSPLKTVALTLLTFFGMQLHEAFFFWGVPAVALVLFDGNRKSKSGIFFTVTAAGMFLLQSLYHGTPDHARAIVESWQGLLGADAISPQEKNSIGALGWDTLATVEMHLRTNFFTHPFSIATFFLRIVEFACVYYIVVFFLYAFRQGTSFDEERRTQLSALFLYSIICLLPMFVLLSCDYGRLYQYAIVSTFTLFLLLPKEKAGRLLPRKAYRLAARLNRGISRAVVPTKGMLLLMLLLFNVSEVGYHPALALSESVLVTTLNTLPYLYNFFRR